MLKKSLLFCIISYLVARLEMVLEISKLTIFRFRPHARIVNVTRQERVLQQGIWVFSRSRDYFMFYSVKLDAPEIKALPEKILN